MGEVLEKTGLEKEKLRASLTVEASVLLPVALFIIVGGINLGYDLFQQAKDSAAVQEELEQLNPVEIVRKNTMIQELKK